MPNRNASAKSLFEYPHPTARGRLGSLALLQWGRLGKSLALPQWGRLGRSLALPQWWLCVSLEGRLSARGEFVPFGFVGGLSLGQAEQLLLVLV
ncbi:MAG: hypothetical protein FJ387_29030 [Verrucomicrobia bacterium]|nr:hypothetical protein [Verrucomicrobiota bacterium]